MMIAYRLKKCLVYKKKDSLFETSKYGSFKLIFCRIMMMVIELQTSILCVYGIATAGSMHLQNVFYHILNLVQNLKYKIFVNDIFV